MAAFREGFQPEHVRRVAARSHACEEDGKAAEPPVPAHSPIGESKPMTTLEAHLSSRPKRSLRAWRKANLNKVNVAIGAVAFLIVSALILQQMPPVRFRLDATPLLEAPGMVKVHVAAAVTAFALGCILMTGIKGTTLHRALGYGWVAAMATTAISSFMLFGPVGSYFSLIHALSAWTLIVLPMGIAAARRGNIAAHRKTMTGVFTGGMLIAGLFTFLPGRLMWSLFFTA
jgi:uncharacterized membrane protein